MDIIRFIFNVADIFITIGDYFAYSDRINRSYKESKWTKSIRSLGINIPLIIFIFMQVQLERLYKEKKKVGQGDEFLIVKKSALVVRDF